LAVVNRIALIPDLDGAGRQQDVGPLAIRISYITPLRDSRVALAAAGADVELRDQDREPEAVRHYWPADGATYGALWERLQRWARTCPAVQSGRWRVATVPAAEAGGRR
jgi:hypothetical protein